MDLFKSLTCHKFLFTTNSKLALNHYDVLGIAPEATFQEIKRNYRNLVKLYHPDLNPSEEAKIRIVAITAAYEVLSDPGKRSSYDWQLVSGSAHAPTVAPEPEIDERERYRQEYIRWRRRKEQERWERIFHLKAMFYKYQRYFAVVFLVVGLLYSYDYYFMPAKGPFPLMVKINRMGGTAGIIQNKIFATDSEQLFQEVTEQHLTEGYLHYSGILRVPAGVSLDRIHRYHFEGNLYELNNIFPILMMVIALVMLLKRQYEDWILTIGLFPFFFLIFLIILTVELLA